ncbi:hypothetical protein BRD08_01300 [Halobacteriales archaeon SW_10_66_29]|nr:MAG: hypothetical protein BRD08_01300 [Halobacteriales archaeon SW_10_66_29]
MSGRTELNWRLLLAVEGSICVAVVVLRLLGVGFVSDVMVAVVLGSLAASVGLVALGRLPDGSQDRSS